MNCCDANGKCSGGKGCPLGEPPPIDMLDDPADEGAQRRAGRDGEQRRLAAEGGKGGVRDGLR